MGRLLHELAAGSILLPSPRGLRHAPHPLAEGHPAAPPDQLLLQAQHLLNAGSAYGPDLHLPRRATNPAKLQYCFLGQSHSRQSCKNTSFFPQPPRSPRFFTKLMHLRRNFFFSQQKQRKILHFCSFRPSSLPPRPCPLVNSAPPLLTRSCPLALPRLTTLLSSRQLRPSSFLTTTVHCFQPRPPSATEHNHNQPSDIRQCFLTTRSYLTII